MMIEKTFTVRTLKISVGVAVIAPLMFAQCGQPGISAGYAIGAVVSIFSLFSLALLVPMLFRPDSSRHASALLSLTLLMKLPLYCAALYVVTHVRGISPMGAALGIGLTPGIITLRTVGGLLLDGVRNRKPETGAPSALDVVRAAEAVCAAEVPPAPETHALDTESMDTGRRGTQSNALPVYEGG